MRKAYSEDLRKCVINCYERGMPKKLIIALFINIGKDTLNRWIRQYKATGTITTKNGCSIGQKNLVMTIY